MKAIHVFDTYVAKQDYEIRETEELLHTNPNFYGKLNHRQIALIKHALAHPNAHYRIEPHRQIHHITYDTARTDLLNLAKLGLLQQQKIGKAFVFVAPIDMRTRI